MSSLLGGKLRINDDLIFHQKAIESLKSLLATQKQRSDRLTVPQFKELTGISRKYAIPLLEFLDRERITRRSGDERIIL
jgi:selenocysteine-specific elongation factor